MWKPSIILASSLGLLAFLAANIVCWSVGVGSTPKRAATELDRYFGWPAYYRVELWVSNDPTLASRILRAAPFYDPNSEMTRAVRHFSSAALSLNILFFATASAALTVVARGRAGGRVRMRTLILGTLLAAVLMILYGIAGRVSIYL